MHTVGGGNPNPNFSDVRHFWQKIFDEQNICFLSTWRERNTLNGYIWSRSPENHVMRCNSARRRLRRKVWSFLDVQFIEFLYFLRSEVIQFCKHHLNMKSLSCWLVFYAYINQLVIKMLKFCNLTKNPLLVN